MFSFGEPCEVIGHHIIVRVCMTTVCLLWYRSTMEPCSNTHAQGRMVVDDGPITHWWIPNRFQANVRQKFRSKYVWDIAVNTYLFTLWCAYKYKHTLNEHAHFNYAHYLRVIIIIVCHFSLHGEFTYVHKLVQHQTSFYQPCMFLRRHPSKYNHCYTST